MAKDKPQITADHLLIAVLVVNLLVLSLLFSLGGSVDKLGKLYNDNCYVTAKTPLSQAMHDSGFFLSAAVNLSAANSTQRHEPCEETAPFSCG